MSSQRYTVQEAAKMMGVGSITLFRTLREANVINVNNTPYQQYIDQGILAVKQREWATSTGPRFYSRTMITNKGIKWIQEHLVQCSKCIRPADGAIKHPQHRMDAAPSDNPPPRPVPTDRRKRSYFYLKHIHRILG